jgi:hypothetical protein
MRCHSRPYLSTISERTNWKAAAFALLLSLTATPALASNGRPDASAAAANFAEGMTALDQDAAEVRRLTERVVGLEQTVGQLGVAEAPPAPTAAELKRAKQEAEQQAEFQHQVWTMP